MLVNSLSGHLKLKNVCPPTSQRFC